MKYKYITKAQKILMLSRSYHKNISVSIHIFKLNVLFSAMQKLSVIKLWVTGKVESSEVETNSLNPAYLFYLFIYLFLKNLRIPVLYVVVAGLGQPCMSPRGPASTTLNY